MDDPGPSSTYYRSFAFTSSGPIRPPSAPSSPILNASVPAQDLDQDLYSILNLSRTASESEIRERYRSLATIYHPDRQRSDTTRQAAHSQFTQIQRAYEILVDPTKRTIYDLFGEEGLKTSWELGPRIKSQDELKRFFTAQAYEKKMMDAESLVKPKSDMELVLDARAVFLSKKFFKDPDLVKHDPLNRLLRIRPGRAVLKHSFETPLSKNTQLVFEGQALARNGRGGANFVGTVKHQFSPRLWVEASTTFLQPRIGRCKGTFALDDDQYITANLTQQSLWIPPNFGLTYGRRLYANTTGFIAFESGTYSIGKWGNDTDQSPSSLSVGLTTTKRDGSGWTIQTTAGLIASRVSADWSTKQIPGGLKLKFGTEVGVASSLSAFVNAEGRLTDNLRAGLILQVEVGGGIIMKLKFNRLGQKVSIPILLAERLDPTVLFFSALLPTVGYAGLYRYYLAPRKKRRIQERIQELREEHHDFIIQKKNEAREAVALMERSVSQKVALERERNGLIIISAHYGLATSFTPRGFKESNSGNEEEIIDVTIATQALVTDGKLYIPGGKGKFNLLGFWDPCIGENKKLRVDYLFRGKVHQVTVDDVSTLRAPVKAHAVDQ